MPWSTQYHSLDDARHFVRLNASLWIARERLIVSMWDVASGRFVGGCPCEVDWSVPSFEIGYWLRSSAEGHGYVTEAARLLTDYFFATYDAKRVFIRCDARNTRSAAVAERLGFVREARLRNYALAQDGVLQDMLIYAVTPEDWATRTEYGGDLPHLRADGLQFLQASASHLAVGVNLRQIAVDAGSLLVLADGVVGLAEQVVRLVAMAGPCR